MSPGQDIPVAIENAVIMLAISASKIERESARRIGHQNNGYCPKHSFSFWALRSSAASTSFSNTFLEVLLPAFAYGSRRFRIGWQKHHPMTKSLAKLRAFLDNEAKRSTGNGIRPIERVPVKS